MKLGECALNGDIRFPGKLYSVEWLLVTDVLGKPVDVIFMG